MLHFKLFFITFDNMMNISMTVVYLLPDIPTGTGRTKSTMLRLFNGLFSRTTWVSLHQKSKPFCILM